MCRIECKHAHRQPQGVGVVLAIVLAIAWGSTPTASNPTVPGEFAGHATEKCIVLAWATRGGVGDSRSLETCSLWSMQGQRPSHTSQSVRRPPMPSRTVISGLTNLPPLCLLALHGHPPPPHARIWVRGADHQAAACKGSLADPGRSCGFLVSWFLVQCFAHLGRDVDTPAHESPLQSGHHSNPAIQPLTPPLLTASFPAHAAAVNAAAALQVAAETGGDGASVSVEQHRPSGGSPAAALAASPRHGARATPRRMAAAADMTMWQKVPPGCYPILRTRNGRLLSLQVSAPA